nr:DNA-processing protein DprA [Mycolicibacterium komanii]CRL70050.1 putative Rossmann fold nucleotide-binding protein involved in DNA uptake [Mycolicibacterium komanii]
MTMLDERDLAVLALTSRLTESEAKPLSAREFWALRRKVEPSVLHGRTATEIAADSAVTGEDADRIARLFDRAAGLAMALEKLDHSGIWTVTGVGEDYPERLRGRLRDAAPPVLHGVGDISLLGTDGVGVVGSRSVSEEGAQVAREIGECAVRAGLPIVSGAARGVDRDAMNAAFEAGGQVVGLPADSLERAITRRGTRQGVTKGRICLLTPFTPSAPFSVGNAMDRNKVIYGLSRVTLVVASDLETGGTWAGAVEALKHNYGRVAVWNGAGSGPGNKALIERGADDLSELSYLQGYFDDSAAPALRVDEPHGGQMTLGFGG